MQRRVDRFDFVPRYLLALLFIFSGFVKAVDPMGSAIKFGEYMVVFDMGFLFPMKIFFGVVLASVELLLGLLLLFGVWRKITSWTVLLFMSFFTLLTVYIYAENPVSDCGCFGDAVKLSNGETLLKNVVFLFFAVLFFIQNKHNRIGKPVFELTYASLIVLFAFGISVYSLSYLPPVDFLTYKVGVNISEAMSVPPGAAKSEYETVLVYKNLKDNSIREFALEDTTWYDTSTWEYVDTKTEQIKDGYTPPIKSFVIMNDRGEVQTDAILNDDRLTFVLVNLDPNKLTYAKLNKIKPLVDFALSNGHRVVGFSNNDIFRISDMIDIPMDDCFMIDETTLKSFMRSNVGIVVLDKGTIVAKWSIAGLPGISNNSQLDEYIERNTNKQSVFLISVSFLLSLLLVSFLFFKKNLK